EAHALGVVHRDLKPENIILRRLRTGIDLVKVVDFGLATILDRQGTGITRPGLVCGTPDYMSPEQGRGEKVDGRGDLYSLGVMLFELLTDRLPYVDETPTKLVMRHIHDPIPNPQTVAPDRQIPPLLASVCMNALAKRVDDRYPDADAMQQAILKAKEELLSQKQTKTQKICPACGHKNDEDTNFCGACGHRFNGPQDVSNRGKKPSGPPSFSSGGEGRPFVGRTRELFVLEQARAMTMQGDSTCVFITGEAGVGKSRLAKEFARQCHENGDLIVATAPHPTGAPVPYHAVRELLCRLLNCDAEGLRQLAIDPQTFSDPLARAGAAEVAEPKGLSGLPGRSRAGAVRAAVRSALRSAKSQASSGQLLLLFDDLPRMDGLSRRVIQGLPSGITETAVLVLATARQSTPPHGATHIELEGFDLGEAARVLTGESKNLETSSIETDHPGQTRLLPLYLEQLGALGTRSSRDETLPPRLADAIAARIDRLELPTKRLFQAISVLGMQCNLESLAEVANEEDMNALDNLVGQDFLTSTATEIRVRHPYVRDLVEASIPAEARRRLHQRALEHATGAGAPLEVRAEHAFRAEMPMSALVLLERMGDEAIHRGDAEASVLAYQRALTMARHEALESGDAVLDSALTTFSRKLGGALQEAGDISGADGVLREALDLTAPLSSDRARMLLYLGKITVRRDRVRHALRLFGQALEIATRCADEDLKARIQLELARARRVDGDTVGAANAYRRSLQSATESPQSLSYRAIASIEMGEVLTEIGDTDEAERAFDDALTLAHEASTPAVAAMAIGSLGNLEELQGHRDKAVGHYRDAIRLCGEAGDAAGRARWRRAAEISQG
ncbi:MAG: AAA family ATPase, partial [Myxococcota bacterium]